MRCPQWRVEVIIHAHFSRWHHQGISIAGIVSLHPFKVQARYLAILWYFGIAALGTVSQWLHEVILIRVVKLGAHWLRNLGASRTRICIHVVSSHREIKRFLLWVLRFFRHLLVTIGPNRWGWSLRLFEANLALIPLLIILIWLIGHQTSVLGIWVLHFSNGVSTARIIKIWILVNSVCSFVNRIIVKRLFLLIYRMNSMLVLEWPSRVALIPQIFHSVHSSFYLWIVWVLHRASWGLWRDKGLLIVTVPQARRNQFIYRWTAFFC